jgi:molybdate transport system substrate-binding protein
VGLGLGALLLGGAGQAAAVELNVLAAGAVEAILREMAPAFEKESGHTLKIFYAPVGALRDKIYAGEPADVTIVTPVIIEQLQGKSLVRPETRQDLGSVGGGIAVKKGAPRPAVGTPDELRQALLAAEEVYTADPKIATAGQYLLKVADQLGVGEAVRKKLKTVGGGKVSMEAMAKSPSDKVIGLTQVSEILSVPAVDLIGPYPGNLQTKTTYTAITLARTTHLPEAQAFLKFLMSAPVQARFKQQGYEPPAR